MQSCCLTSMSAVLYSFIAFACALSVLAVLRQRRRASILPPGPPGDPLVGHLLRMPLTDSALVFHQWSKTYGAVMHLKVLGRSMIILDTYQAAVDLLDKRGLIYSDRPKFTLYELLGWDPSLTFLQYGKKHYNTQRQMHQSYLSRHKAEEFKPMQTQEARTLVRNLIEASPDKYEKLMSRFATGIITQIVAGHRITSNDDPYLRMSKMVYEALAKTGPPGGSPLDFFPLLQHFPPWFPGAKHVGVVRAWRPTMRELYEYPLSTVKKLQKAGEALPSFILDQLEQMGEGEDEEDLKGAAATMFAAGEATTWSSLCIFVLAMVLNPDCQAKAQKEIDSVVGALRLPEAGDRRDLPIVEGILQETLRWRPGVPLGVPHRVMEEDIYHGMRIPKGSLVFANIKGMSLDESVYSNPTSFRPERYLPKPAGNEEPHFNNVAFGFGRRICTGQYVADNTLWIAIASILATCNITNMVDEHGKIIVPDSILTDGLVSHPQNLRCMITPRSADARALTMETAV
ncbi:cytochrome P450 [Mycena albidolilacea]|uniref:Cytochrome P450 n=1 Tax=Mycena albidolilacea TaxID=1033008 RepID=A0AAD7ENZ7_9AGAR|nr:cytochrome P450 [Mycena albidolilacea]